MVIDPRKCSICVVLEVVKSLIEVVISHATRELVDVDRAAIPIRSLVGYSVCRYWRRVGRADRLESALLTLLRL